MTYHSDNSQPDPDSQHITYIMFSSLKIAKNLSTESLYMVKITNWVIIKDKESVKVSQINA